MIKQLRDRHLRPHVVAFLDFAAVELLAMLAFTGMRIGEATALRWSDLDEAAATIRVRRSIDRGLIDTTKTDTKRTAPLLATLAAILSDHRRALDFDGLPTEGNAWLFPSRKVFHKGKPMHKKALRKPLLAALAKAGLETGSPRTVCVARSTT